MRDLRWITQKYTDYAKRRSNAGPEMDYAKIHRLRKNNLRNLRRNPSFTQFLRSITQPNHYACYSPVGGRPPPASVSVTMRNDA
jgi:hypothetical protein